MFKLHTCEHQEHRVLQVKSTTYSDQPLSFYLDVFWFPSCCCFLFFFLFMKVSFPEKKKHTQKQSQKIITKIKTLSSVSSDWYNQ